MKADSFPCDTQKQRLSRGQTGSSLLLVSLALVSLLLGAAGDWVAGRVERKRKERDFVVAIEAAGGRGVYDFEGLFPDRGKPRGQGGSEREWPGPAWLRELLGDNFFCEVVEVQSPKALTDAELGPIEALPEIRRLYLVDTKLSDTGLAHFKRLTTLTSLNLGRTNISDTGLESLERLTGLEKLDLAGTQISDAGLVHLRGLSKLTALQLSGNHVGDEGLRQLGALKRLANLDLAATAVGNAGLRHLKALPRLQALSLRETRVDDAGLRELAECVPHLKWLDLIYDKVSDAGLVHLKRVADLTVVYLEYSDVTVAGMREFETAKSMCRVEPHPFIMMTRAVNWRPIEK